MDENNSAMTFEEGAQAISIMSGEGPDATEGARQILRQAVLRAGAAGPATAEALRELGIDADQAQAMHDARAAHIRTRWPHLSAEIVAFAVAQGLSDDDIAGTLWSIATKKRRHQAAVQASRHWRPPSSGKKQSLKSKRRR